MTTRPPSLKEAIADKLADEIRSDPDDRALVKRGCQEADNGIKLILESRAVYVNKRERAQLDRVINLLDRIYSRVGRDGG